MAFKGLLGCWRLQGGPGGSRKVWDGLAGSGRIQRGPERSRIGGRFLVKIPANRQKAYCLTMLIPILDLKNEDNLHN